MVLGLCSGYMTDKIGQPLVLFGGFAAGALGLLAAVAWSSPYAMVLTGAALGLLSGTVPVAASAMVGATADRKRRPLEYGIIFSWRDLGVVASSVGVNLLGMRFDLNTAFSVFVVIFAGCAALSLLLPRYARQRP
jgi:MFS family permease